MLRKWQRWTVGLALVTMLPAACKREDFDDAASPSARDDDPAMRDDEMLPVVPMDDPLPMEQFSDCEGLLGGLRADALSELERRVEQLLTQAREPERNGFGGAPGFGGMGGSGQGDDLVQRFVETNLDAKGADEADLAKAHANDVYVLSSGKLHSFSMSEEERLDLISKQTIPGSAKELLVDGGNVVVFSTEGRFPTGNESASLGTCDLSQNGCRAHTRATLFQPLPSGVLALEKEYLFEGEYLGARLAGGFGRLLLDAGAQAFEIEPPKLELLDPFGLPYSDEELVEQVELWAERVRNAIEESELTHWLPKSYQRDGLDWELIPPACEGYHVPNADLETKGHTRIVSLDLGGGSEPKAISITGSTNLVYHNDESLVLAYVDPRFQAGLIDASQSVLHLLSFADDGTSKYEASGLIPGVIHNRYSMYEADGTILLSATRAVRESEWSVVMENRVLAVERKGDELALVGNTPPMAEGEDIYATRFIGDRAYVVTFRETDPLFIVDVSEPTKPTVLGEVEVPGFSEYVHPLDANNLITIGRISSQVQLQIFDVSTANPKRTHQTTVGDYYSDSPAGRDPRMFHFDDEHQIASFPLQPRWMEHNHWWYGAYGEMKMVNYLASEEGGLVRHSDIEHSCNSGYYYSAPCYAGRARMWRTVKSGGISYIISEAGVSAHDLPDFDVIDYSPYSSDVPILVDVVSHQPDGVGGAGGFGGSID